MKTGQLQSEKNFESTCDLSLNVDNFQLLWKDLYCHHKSTQTIKSMIYFNFVVSGTNITDGRLDGGEINLHSSKTSSFLSDLTPRFSWAFYTRIHSFFNSLLEPCKPVVVKLTEIACFFSWIRFVICLHVKSFMSKYFCSGSGPDGSNMIMGGVNSPTKAWAAALLCLEDAGILSCCAFLYASSCFPTSFGSIISASKSTPWPHLS